MATGAFHASLLADRRAEKQTRSPCGYLGLNYLAASGRHSGETLAASQGYGVTRGGCMPMD